MATIKEELKRKYPNYMEVDNITDEVLRLFAKKVDYYICITTTDNRKKEWKAYKRREGFE